MADAITHRFAEFAEHRAVIEQAKGVLMAVYDLDADAAFELLKWRSQTTNTKLRVLAEELMTDCRSLQSPQKSLLRSTFDYVVLNAHGRHNDV